MTRLAAATATASWLTAIAIVVLAQQLTIWALVPFVIGIAGLSLVAARVLGQIDKSQRNKFIPLLVAPAIVGSAAVPLYANQPVLAFSLLAGTFAVVTIALAAAAERRTA
ncbi:hypothetical protein PV375_04115 [Gulosibacter sp. GYB002]|uniref:hypothetical protein n=1 Tax=Gulosibacter sp. GYB002 TaxID=2994391 RepID=UPI002F962564